ncbi:hypothetical protein ACHAXT_008447 [Thalassiosira profunda]
MSLTAAALLQIMDATKSKNSMMAAPSGAAARGDGNGGGEAKAPILPPRLIVCEGSGCDSGSSETQSSTDEEKEEARAESEEPRTPETSEGEDGRGGEGERLAEGMERLRVSTREREPGEGEEEEGSSTASTIESTAHLSPLHVGRIIGRGGEVVRDVQSRSGARIDVNQSVPNGEPRIITYRGTREEIDFAKRLVAILCQTNGDGEHGNKDRSGELPLGKAHRTEVLVPGSTIGRIIGRGGATVRELQIRSGARIQVDHTGDPDPRDHGIIGKPKADDALRKVTITGTDASVAAAEEMIAFLAEHPGADGRALARGGHPYGPRDDHPLRSSGRSTASHPLHADGASVASLDGASYYWTGSPAMGPAPAAYGHGHVPQGSWDGSWDGASFSPQAVEAGSVIETDVLPIARRDIPHVIGRKGATVDRLQTSTNCDIQIDQRQCEIHISGARGGIEVAKRMVCEVIERGGGSVDYAAEPHPQSYQQPQAYPHYGGILAHTPPQQYSFLQPAALPQPHQPQYQRQFSTPLPVPWREAVTNDGRVYYFNPETNESRWDWPSQSWAGT